MTKRFYIYEHRTTTLQEIFVRVVLRRPIHVREAAFRLANLDLQIAAGESVALVGRNGSGKSTVLRLIAGVYPPTDGVIETRGRVVGVISLGASFHSELTGAENVALYATAIGLNRRELAGRFDEIVDFSGIGDFVHVPIKYYSPGMGARLAFSVALCAQPDVFLLDEVLSVVDDEFRVRCIERLGRFHAGGGTLVVVSHDTALLRRLCARGVWLDQGAAQLSGGLETVLAAYDADLRERS